MGLVSGWVELEFSMGSGAPRSP